MQKSAKSQKWLFPNQMFLVMKNLNKLVKIAFSSIKVSKSKMAANHGCKKWESWGMGVHPRFINNSSRPNVACKLFIIGSDNGLSLGRRQTIIWTDDGILLIGPLGTNFNEILIEIYIFSFKKMHLKLSSREWRPFCPSLIVIIYQL